MAKEKKIETFDKKRNSTSLTSLNEIKDQIKEISLDNSVEDVLQWNEEGFRLRFDYRRMLILPDEAVSELYKENRTDYKFAHDLWKEVERQKKEGSRKDPNDPRIEVLGGSASGRVRIEGKQEGMHYSAQRAEDVFSLMRQGYQVCDSSDPATFGDGTAGGVKCTHARNGDKELVLVKIPKERYEAHLKAVGEASRKRCRATRDPLKSEGKRQGIKTQDDSKNYRVRIKEESD